MKENVRAQADGGWACRVDAPRDGMVSVTPEGVYQHLGKLISILRSLVRKLYANSVVIVALALNKAALTMRNS